MAGIEVRDLTMSFQQGETAAVQALERVTLDLRAGEFVAVAGRAGSGKTTLLRCMGLLLRPTSGQVVIDGVDTAALADGQRTALRGRRVGFVFPARGLLPTLTALENVMLPLRYARPSRGATQRARDLLDLVGLGDHLRQRPDQLTTGQAQRVAIARALVREPGLLLADEPTGEVDDETSDELLYLLQQVNRMSGITVVVATHDGDVASCTDRVIRLRDGRVASDEHLRRGLRELR